MAQVFWTALMERSIQEYAASSLLNVAMDCGANGYLRLGLPYMRTDTARNVLVREFLSHAKDPNDTLVMLDCDHNYPQDVVSRLAAHTQGVVGALAFRRGEPFDPLFFIRMADGNLHSVASWEDSATVIPCACVTTSAIAIKRWVFDRLHLTGFNVPYFRYKYVDNNGHTFPTEDMYFGEICERAGIPHHCDVTLEIPHLTVSEVVKASWEKYLADNQDETIEYEKVTYND